MALLRAPILVLLCLGVVTSQQYAGGSGAVQSDAASPEMTKCQFSEKELHTTVRSAALSALSGICDPVEMEARLQGMEQRLKHRIEELKETLTKLFIDGVAYDYDEEGDIALEQHRYTGIASTASAVETTASATGARVAAERGSRSEDAGAGAASGGATQGQHSGFQAYNRIETAADARKTSSSTRRESERRTVSSAAIRGDTAVSAGTVTSNGTSASAEEDTSMTGGEQSSGSRRSSSRSYSYKWNSSSREPSEEGSAGQSRGGASRSGGASDQRVGAEEEQGQDGRSSGSTSHRYSYERRTSSSRGPTQALSGEDSQEARAIGGAPDSSRRYEAARSRSRGSSRSESRSYSHQRRTSLQGSSRNDGRERSYESRAIGGDGYSRGGDSQYSQHNIRSSSRHSSQERRSSSRNSSTTSDEPPYVDFGDGGGPEQRRWFPGTSRTTAGTGVPDLSGRTVRTGGFGFGAVGEPLEDDGSSGRRSGIQVRAGEGTRASGDSEVLFRDQQTYATSAEARRPGSVAGGDSSQYAAFNSSWSSSGERQVTAYDASSASRPKGTPVRFLTSYTPTQDEGGYISFNDQQSRGTSWNRSRHSGSRSRTGRRRTTTRRRSRVYDTISSLSNGQSTPLSRFSEIGQYNDTVYEVDGKRRYSYYWEINDFRTMMETWEHHHSLRSPSFYVYRGGYRMYIRVFPSRQGGNVYLHTGLTQGRYDDQLAWPFELRLRLSLLDHSNLRHDIRSRIWDPRRLCSRWNWQRPRRRDNFECVGLGFPQSLLDTQRFLLNGAVLLKLDVFLEN